MCYCAITGGVALTHDAQGVYSAATAASGRGDVSALRTAPNGLATCKWHLHGESRLHVPSYAPCAACTSHANRMQPWQVHHAAISNQQC